MPPVATVTSPFTLVGGIDRKVRGSRHIAGVDPPLDAEIVARRAQHLDDFGLDQEAAIRHVHLRRDLLRASRRHPAGRSTSSEFDTASAAG